MASEVPKKMITIRFEGCLAGLGGVISSAAIFFPSHRSLFTVMYFVPSFEYQVSFPVKTRSSMHTGSEPFLHSWAVALSKFSGKSSLYE